MAGLDSHPNASVPGSKGDTCLSSNSNRPVICTGYCMRCAAKMPSLQYGYGFVWFFPLPILFVPQDSLAFKLILLWLTVYLSEGGNKRGFRNLLLDGWWLEFWEIILLAAGDVECNPGPITDINVDGQILGKDILFRVYKSVFKCRANWYNLCLALHISDDDLAAIDKKHNSDVDTCLRKGLTIWLQRNHDVDEDDAPTWRMLVDAVANAAGGNDCALALEIAEQHKAIPSDEATTVSPSDESHPSKADLAKAKEMSSEFNKLYRSVMRHLKMDIAEIKQVLRFSSSPLSLRRRCVPPSVYETATSTKELLDRLYPDYVNPQDIFLLEEIVNNSGSRNGKCKRLVRIYSDKFF